MLIEFETAESLAELWADIDPAILAVVLLGVIVAAVTWASMRLNNNPTHWLPELRAHLNGGSATGARKIGCQVLIATDDGRTEELVIPNDCGLQPGDAVEAYGTRVREYRHVWAVRPTDGVWQYSRGLLLAYLLASCNLGGALPLLIILILKAV
ncbi:hypothetical protein ACFQNE_13810 [Gordonia phosphorivorans]|uniref:RING-type E3 ubiquitin transferase n=1 Tax=Gordonia phosphorivorans TaxID=1056982 RepID=A0ABV6HCA4_9ACTN